MKKLGPWLMLAIIVGGVVGISYLIPSGPKAPQYVLLSFDGGKISQVWKDSLDFAKEMNAAGRPVSFTYFINGSFLLTKEDIYNPPIHASGPTAIAFDTTADVANMVRQVNRAYAEGHEIASHTVAHFGGRTWPYGDWETEFNAFKTIVDRLNNAATTSKTGRLAVTMKDIIGFRAPYLATNAAMYSALAQARFAYDASDISQHAWPYRDRVGIWHIPISKIRMTHSTQPITAMDSVMHEYVAAQWGSTLQNTPAWDNAKTDIVSAYRNTFDKSYYGNRAPVSYLFHFWRFDHDIYTEAMKEFARDVCGLPDVRCTTHAELVRYLNATKT